MFIGYTLASFIGPVVSANALATTGSYSSAFPFLGALCIVGLVLLSLAWMFFKKMKPRTPLKRKTRMCWSDASYQ